jgi:hypothetical protein
MMALFTALAAVAVERLVSRRRLRLHEVLADVGWLALIFALIEFAYLMFVEALTLNYGVLARPLWYTEWPAFKSLLLEASIGVMLVLASVWLESAGIRIELRRPRMAPAPRGKAEQQRHFPQKKCDIEWREAS